MNNYTHIARSLHWLIAGMIISQYILAELAERAADNNDLLNQLALLANHKSIGMTIFALAVIRLGYRLLHPAPTLPATMPQWQIKASHISHLLLYGFLFALPLTGWLMSSAKAYSVSWFNVVALPDLISPSEPLAETLHHTHHWLGEALFIIAIVHILAALKHHFFDKDDILQRMASAGSWLLLIATIAILVGLFGRFFDTQTIDEDAARPSSQNTDANQQVVRQSSLPKWQIDYTDSFIKFSGDQAGAPFDGEWQTWEADIRFSPTQLEESRFDVYIDPNSAFTNDTERDDTIRSPEFFDTARFTKINFSADTFAEQSTNFSTNGRLSMKGITDRTVLTFSVTEEGNKRILSGTAPIDRISWQIGTGDWSDTSWVGQQVMVEVRVVAITQ